MVLILISIRLRLKWQKKLVIGLSKNSERFNELSNINTGDLGYKLLDIIYVYFLKLPLWLSV